MSQPPTDATSRLRAADKAHLWHPVHADGGVGRRRPRHHRRRRPRVPHRHRRPPLHRRHLQPVVQPARPPASGDRRGHPRPTRPHRPLDAAGPRRRRRRSNWRQRLARLAPQGLTPRLLLRQRRHGRRDRPQDGLPVLAAVPAARAAPHAVRQPLAGLPRRHAGRGQRRRHRPLPRHLPAAPLRDAPRPVAVLLPLPAGQAPRGLRHGVRRRDGRPPGRACRRGGRRHPRAARPGGRGDDHPARRATCGAWPRPAAGTTSCSSATRWPPASAAPAACSPASTRTSGPTSCAWPRGSAADTCRWPPPWPPSGSTRHSWATRPQGRTFFHGHTYTGNALACAAGVASLEIFEKDRVLERIGRLSESLGGLLEKVEAMPHVGEVRRCGLMVGIELVADRADAPGVSGRRASRLAVPALPPASTASGSGRWAT